MDEALEVTTPVTEVTAVTPPETPAPTEKAPEPKGLDRLKVEKEAPIPGEPTKETPAAKEGEITPPVFKAREKFKTMIFGKDEQQEHDVPAWLKPMLKDAETEKEAIALLERAYGIESVKESRASVARERDEIKQKHATIENTIVDVRKTYQRGDIDGFLQKLAIPQERMLQWALDKVNYSQLPPEQQRALDERTEADRRAYAAEQQTMTLGEQIKEQSRQAKQTLLQSSLSRPDVTQFAQAFDAQAGTPGSFFEQVRATGELAWVQSEGKVDLTPDQAIEQVMKKWAKFLPTAAPAPVTPTAPAVAPAAKVVTPPAPTVIPNVQGRTTSPMKSGPKSIEDLKKLRDQAGA